MWPSSENQIPPKDTLPALGGRTFGGTSRREEQRLIKLKVMTSCWRIIHGGDLGVEAGPGGPLRGPFQARGGPGARHGPATRAAEGGELLPPQRTAAAASWRQRHGGIRPEVGGGNSG